MVSFHYIRSIAFYETKTLLRSWFFRIFAIIAIVVLAFFNFGVLIQSGGGAGEWELKGLPSLIPYVNLLLLNVVQAIIAIFLASDFLKRDKKLDTTEVIYVRPMTNGEYVLGKTLGNMFVFIVLNLIVLVIALIFNLITKNVSVNGLSYLYYFLLISIPTLVFIMGLSFLVMSVIKNQAVTFVVMLGYVAISLFYLKSKFYYLFDYMAYNIPLTFSDFVGFGDVNRILVLRGMYFFLGLSFIFFTIVLLRRLPHSKSTRNFSLVFGSLFLFLGVYLGVSHVSSYNEAENLRQQMMELNDEFIGIRQLDVKKYDIKLEHHGENIICESTLDVRNDRVDAIDKVIFSLNPGLKVSHVTVNGKDQPFNQKLNIVELTGVSFAPGQEATIRFRYEGGINEAACYLDIDDETREKAYQNFMYQIDKRYAFVTSKYLLLTREADWYPVPGAGFGHKNNQWLTRQFSNFKLDVVVDPGLIAISQGKATQENGHFIFTSSHPQSQISLIVGDYEQKQAKIDGLDFSVYVRKGHDYFSGFFEEIKDTVPAIIAESLQDFERNVDLYYPFDRFSVVEVPIQFYSYERVLTGAREQMQPGMVLFAEKGVLTREADFYGQMQSRRRFGPDRDQNMTPREKKIQVLQNFLSSFTEESGRPDFSMTRGQVQVEETPNNYYVFPLFYDYAYYIRSDRWPVADKVFESYKKESTGDSPGMGFMREMEGMSEDEKGNLALLTHSFEEILNDPDELQIVDNVIDLKGKTLFSIIKRKAGDAAFADFLYDYLNRFKFKTATIENFASEVQQRFGIDLISYMDNWFKTTKLPAFLFSKVNAVKVLDQDQQKTMIKFKVTNTEDAEGIFTVDFRTGGPGGGRFGGMGGSSETISKLVHMDGNQTKEVSFLLSGTPRGISINTFTSRNIPNELRVSLDDIPEDKNAVPHEGEKVVDTPVRIAENNEIILDNEDPGFSVSKADKANLLRRLLVPEETSDSKYAGFSRWRAPREWTLTTSSSFYGAYIRSAYYIRSGDGSKKVTWKVPIKENAYYDVYVYVYKDSRGFGGPPGRGRGDDNKGEYHYIVHHDDGDEEATIDLKTADEGWNHLGAYYFSPDTAIIEMTDKSEARMVVADAVKLIKR